MTSSETMNSDSSNNSSNRTLHSHHNCNSKNSTENPYKTIALILVMVIASLIIIIGYQIYKCLRRKNNNLITSPVSYFRKNRKNNQPSRSNISLCPLTDFPTISLPSPVASSRLTNDLPDPAMMDHQIPSRISRLKPPSELSKQYKARPIPANIYIPI